MRLRAVLSTVRNALAPRPRKGPRWPVRLRCETLEGREVPAANLLGVNLAGVEDWSYDRLFADAMKSARRPSDFGSHLGQPPIDSHGWPATDASIVVWQGITNMNGTYKLSFTGQADVYAWWGANQIVNKAYNPTTNTTTADIIYYPTDGSGLLLGFKNSRRTPNSPTNTGVTNIKLMRPISPGSSTSYDPSVTFTQPLKDLVSRFSVVRMMDDTGSNGADVNGVWGSRRPADYASQAAVGPAKGMAWEYAIQFWNETDKDAWVNIPFTADDNFVTQLATLLKNTLEPGRKIYVEFSNELWNAYGSYPCAANKDAAVAEVQANPSSPLNYDGVYPSRDPDGWELAKRRVALRTVQISNIFRQVFGDQDMMTRVRPVLMSQLGYTAGWLASGLDFVEDYFDSAARPAPHPASYYIYGAGGSAYEDPDWSIGSGITVDQIFNTMPNNFAPALKEDLDWVAAFGLKRIAYEGGPELDNLQVNQSVPDSTLDAAVNDPRMEGELAANHDLWSNYGGDLLMYFATTGGHEWGLTSDPFNLDTPKLRGINDLNARPAAPVTAGKLAPVDLTTDDFRVPYYQNTIANLAANSTTQDWNGAVFRVDTAGAYAVRATGTFSNGGRVEIFVDGRSVGTVDVPANADTTTISLGTLSPGEHGIVLRARAGSFGLSRVSVLAGPAVPTAPDSLSATTSGTSVSLTWADRSANETGFVVERATDGGFTTGFTTFNLGANATSYTDTGLAAGTTYYYRVRAVNANGSSGYSNTASVTILPPTGGPYGLAGTYFDNQDFTGRLFTRTDPMVNFLWDLGSPADGIGPDTFSVRWVGQVRAAEGGTYQFRTESDDGVRLWVNGKLVINDWTDHAGRFDASPSITLAAGQKYDIRLEYYEAFGGSVIRLQWKRPGQTDFEVIPELQLSPQPGGAALFADNFDTGVGNWTVLSGKFTNSTSYAGRGWVYTAVGGGLDELAVAGSAAWTNYSLASWVNLTDLKGGASILGRVVDATHFYQLEIKRDSNGNPGWFLIKRDGKDFVTLASGPLSYTAGTWIKLRLTMSGSTLRAESSVDGSSYTLLGTAADDSYTAGRIGLRAWWATAHFNDLLVQGV
jgi:PA14 domain/Fibronectin type III domain